MNTYWSKGLALCAVAALTACASAPRLPDETTIRINAILNEKPGDGLDWHTERCLSTSRYRSVEIIDEHRLLFRGRGGRVWVNELRTPCHTLRRNDTLMFELRSGSACETDRVTVVDHFTGDWTETGPTCTLGEFRQLTADQAELVEQVLRER